MSEQLVTCPSCGRKIPLSETITQQIEERVRKELKNQIDKKEAELRKEYEGKMEKERERLEEQAKKKARDIMAIEIKNLKTQVEEKSEQIKELEKKELSFLKRERELDGRERTLTLKIEQTLNEERKKIWNEASSKIGEERRLKDREKDEKIAAMSKQIDELKRKAEQGSQQSQGEALELELEEILRSSFRFDDIEPVAKGVRGADVLHKVHTQSGLLCGTILWETKTAKTWSSTWIGKLKDDQRDAKADIGVIVSTALPEGIDRMGGVDGIWVADLKSAIELASLLRWGLTQITQIRVASIGKNEKISVTQLLNGKRGDW